MPIKGVNSAKPPGSKPPPPPPPAPPLRIATLESFRDWLDSQIRLAADLVETNRATWYALVQREVVCALQRVRVRVFGSELEL